MAGIVNMLLFIQSRMVCLYAWGVSVCVRLSRSLKCILSINLTDSVLLSTSVQMKVIFGKNMVVIEEMTGKKYVISLVMHTFQINTHTYVHAQIKNIRVRTHIHTNAHINREEHKFTHPYTRKKKKITCGVKVLTEQSTCTQYLFRVDILWKRTLTLQTFVPSTFEKEARYCFFVFLTLFSLLPLYLSLSFSPTNLANLLQFFSLQFSLSLSISLSICTH